MPGLVAAFAARPDETAQMAPCIGGDTAGAGTNKKLII
jgi:hypothetical protein